MHQDNESHIPASETESFTFIEVQEVYQGMMGPMDSAESDGRWQRVTGVAAKVGRVFGFSSGEGGEPVSAQKVFEIVEVKERAVVAIDGSGNTHEIMFSGSRLERAREFTKDHAQQGVIGGVLSAAIGGLFVYSQSRRDK